MGFKEWDLKRDETIDSKEQAAFVEKFKQKKTPDDCYTPPVIYDVVADYVVTKYGRPRTSFVRPFFPGGDYERHDYPEGCVVVDNPPFSILSKIVDFYISRGVDYFLFAPALTAMWYAYRGATVIYPAQDFTAENGAKVRLAFITSLEPETAARNSPTLYKHLKNANDSLKVVKSLRKYDFPANVIRGTTFETCCRVGVPLSIARRDSAPAKKLDAGAEIYGGGLYLSARAAAERAAAERAAAERAAAERAADERAAAERYELSEREWEMVRSLGKD